jgi:hypothetical protein
MAVRWAGDNAGLRRMPAKLCPKPGRYTLPNHKSSRGDLFFDSDGHRSVMKAKPSNVAEQGSKSAAGRAPLKRTTKTPQRLPRAERQARVLEKAAEYFAEHGLNAQTRAIADACGVSQRLLYKTALCRLKAGSMPSIAITTIPC